jgi:hypothetical protein
MPPSKAEILRHLFRDLDLPEVTGIDIRSMSPIVVAGLLPPNGGPHPMKGILLDKNSGKAYGIASGWIADTLSHNRIPFRAGAIPYDVAAQASEPWGSLGSHIKPVAAAFMRKHHILEAIVFINGTNPCWGVPDGTGCYHHMKAFLEEGSTMTVYN